MCDAFGGWNIRWFLLDWYSLSILMSSLSEKTNTCINSGSVGTVWNMPLRISQKTCMLYFTWKTSSWLLGVNKGHWLLCLAFLLFLRPWFNLVAMHCIGKHFRDGVWSEWHRSFIYRLGKIGRPTLTSTYLPKYGRSSCGLSPGTLPIWSVTNNSCFASAIESKGHVQGLALQETDKRQSQPAARCRAFPSKVPHIRHNFTRGGVN